MHLTRVLASAVLLLACTPKPADTDGEASSSAIETDGAEATSATATTPTTGVDPTAPQTASSATDDTGTSTTTGPSTSTSTTAGTITTTSTTSPTSTSSGPGEDTEGGGLPGACAAACALWDMCSPGTVGPVERCTAGCIEGSEGLPLCSAALAAQWECVAGLSCEEALKFIESTPTSCLEEIGVSDEACMELGCNGEIGGDMETCELMQECNGKKQQYVCDTETCTCIEDDVSGKQCPSEGFCASGFEEQRAAIAACCGWDWGI